MVLQVPIVVVGNKTDQARTTAQPELEAVASLDWEHGYVECSARDNYNVDQVTCLEMVEVVMEMVVCRCSRSSCTRPSPGSTSAPRSRAPAAALCPAHPWS